MDLELRYGYTLQDVHDMARLAVHTASRLGADWIDRYETAYSAIVEALYSADDSPGQPSLVHAGRTAIYAVVDGDRHHHGFYQYKTTGGFAGAGSSPRFVAYWHPLVDVVGSHESAVVERTALHQILPTLQPLHLDALLALAATDDYAAAADALGISYNALRARIAAARRRFLAHWHEGETPHRQRDRRVGSRAEPATHCLAGHEWTPQNTRVVRESVRGWLRTRRKCRACEHDRYQRRRAVA